MNVLVAGGAGYIGSHMCKRLAEAGHAVVVLDDLSTGHREAVQWGELVEASLGDTALVAETLRRHHIDAVMHFAASSLVGESVSDPYRYYRSEEHTSELQSLMRISYAVFCLKKKKKLKQQHSNKNATTRKT